MRDRVRILALASLAVGVAGAPAWASNPGTSSRAGALASGASSQAICEGGSNPGALCPFGTECLGGGTCTGIQDVQVVARGVLTIVTDTILAQGADPTGWFEDTPSLPCVSCENASNSTLTLILEFTLAGESYLFSQSFRDLPTDIDPFSITSSVSPFYTGWNQGAVESTLAEQHGTPLAIRWGLLPVAAEAAVGAVVGQTGSQRVALARVDEVPICSVQAACDTSEVSPTFSDHHDNTDPLATVRRFKVDIALIGP
jgi:hypothetical protein